MDMISNGHSAMDEVDTRFYRAPFATARQQPDVTESEMPPILRS